MLDCVNKKGKMEIKITLNQFNINKKVGLMHVVNKITFVENNLKMYNIVYLHKD